MKSDQFSTKTSRYPFVGYRCCSVIGDADHIHAVYRGLVTCWWISIVILGLYGCQRNPGKSADVSKGLSEDSSFLAVNYAKGFHFEKCNEGTILVVSNPNKPGSEIARYRLLPAGSKVKPIRGYVDFNVPVKRIAASSTTHAGFLSAIGSGDRLMGCNNPDRLFDTLLFNRFRDGSLMDLGHDLEYNLEFLISTNPDLVLQTGIDGQFSPDPRLTATGIPVLFILEWMESTPLGRAEWMKVFGQITGKAKETDSLFNLIVKNYTHYASMGHHAPEKVKVLTGNVFKGSWYLPGGKNFMARFFEDAGMDYLLKNTEQSGSLAMSFESVVYQLSDTPVWINVNVDSISQLLAAEQRYSVFKAIKNKSVFNILNRVNDHGGNDFWEGGTVRPDQVLADLLAIAHPELLPDHQWYYYKPLVFNN